MSDTTRSFLELSDEDLMKLPPPVFNPAEPISTATTEKLVGAEEEVVLDPASEVVDPVPATTDPVIEQEEGEEGKPAIVAEVEDGQNSAATEPAPAGKDGKEPVPAKADAEKGTEPAAEIDHKAELAKIMAPFKANGRDMQVRSADEAVALMQMGANYNKKMAGLKPHLALVKQLEKADLLSNEKIGFLIDLHNKNPEAIGKLIKDSGIDPLDLNEEKVQAYVPNTYAISDKEQAFDEVLESIKDTPTYQRTLDTVANEWDQGSKAQLGEHPQVLKIINDHMASGIYDLIAAEVNHQKALGKLVGVPALAAYNQIGDQLNAAGAFNHLNKVATEPAPIKKVVVAEAAKPNQAVQDQRRAASPTRTSPAKKVATDFNPLNMSDDEFAKLGNPAHM
jgi:hypothetical protein